MSDLYPERKKPLPDQPEEGFLEGLDEGADEAVLLAAIEQRVQHFLQTDPDLLFSYLYRLDIPQSAIEFALYHGEPLTPAQALAHIILERQRTRMKTKRAYPQKPIEGWDSF